MKKAACPQTKPAVVINGADAGRVLHVCRDEQSKVHSRLTHYEATTKERAARAKELLAERVEKLTRVRILNTIRRKLPRMAIASGPRNGRARLFRAARA